MATASWVKTKKKNAMATASWVKTKKKKRYDYGLRDSTTNIDEERSLRKEDTRGD